MSDSRNTNVNDNDDALVLLAAPGYALLLSFPSLDVGTYDLMMETANENTVRIRIPCPARV